MREQLGSRFGCASRALAAGLAVLLGPNVARAAGFDTPILYSARHQAMGGTAIAAVDDPSAAFHNPAGLQGVKGLSFLGDFSLILGKVQGTPEKTAGNLKSDTVVAPFFLLGAGYRVHPWITLGLAGFPVASGGAEYHYVLGTTPTIDRTEIVFFETTPLLSLNIPKDRLLPGTLAFGAGYRISYVTFDRLKGAEENPQFLDLKLRGSNFSGFRVGAQYRPIEELSFGVVFRNKVLVKTKADTATVFATQATDGELDFTLPAKLGFGARVDVAQLGFASDVEWALQSQNKRPPLQGSLNGTPIPGGVPNVFDWTNGVTWRVGAEYRIGRRPIIPLRVGYIFDTRVTNPAYPSAFGTPPTATHTLTAGAGYRLDAWQFNLAVSRRFGSTRVTEDQLGDGCSFCGFAGKYSITMTGLYADASVDLPL
jgi:long-subunit fatty acid transport protein